MNGELGMEIIAQRGAAQMRKVHQGSPLPTFEASLTDTLPALKSLAGKGVFAHCVDHSVDDNEG